MSARKRKARGGRPTEGAAPEQTVSLYVWMGSGALDTEAGRVTRGDKSLPTSVAFPASRRWLELHDYSIRCGQVLELAAFRERFPGNLDQAGKRSGGD